MRTLIFNSPALYSYAVLLFRERTSLDSTACEKNLLFDNHLLIEAPQNKTSSVLVRNGVQIRWFGSGSTPWTVKWI